MVLALDFDGVVGNTILDCMITGLNTYLRFYPQSQLALRGNSELLKDFRKLRVYITNAKGVLVALKAIEENRVILTGEEFDKYFNTFDLQILQKFFKQFYEERRILREKDISRWNKELNPPFKEIINELKGANMNNVYIITSRDYDSVRFLMRDYNLPIKDNHILGNKVLDKLKKLKMLNAPLGEISFVEDSLHNILSIKKISPVRCFLATWGFNSKEQRETATKEGITLLKKEDFHTLLKDVY